MGIRSRTANRDTLFLAVVTPNLFVNSVRMVIIQKLRDAEKMELLSIFSLGAALGMLRFIIFFGGGLPRAYAAPFRTPGPGLANSRPARAACVLARMDRLGLGAPV